MSHGPYSRFLFFCYKSFHWVFDLFEVISTHLADMFMFVILFMTKVNSYVKWFSIRACFMATPFSDDHCLSSCEQRHSNLVEHSNYIILTESRGPPQWCI